MFASLTNFLRRVGTSETTGPSRDAEAAAVAFVERVRDEWQVRFQIQSAESTSRFDLRALLRRDPEMPRPTYDEATTYMRENLVDALPTARLDRFGRSHPIDGVFLGRRRYELEELTGFSDAVFVGLAFRCLLKRTPDAFGYGNALRALRAGTLDRIDVLRGLSASAEGRAAGIVVRKLPWHTFWRRAMRVPIAGPVINWLRTVARLPRLDRQLRMLEARTIARHEDLERRVARWSTYTGKRRTSRRQVSRARSWLCTIGWAGFRRRLVSRASRRNRLPQRWGGVSTS